MKIISYNINGIRAAVRKGFLNWIETESPDVICLQEIKANTDQFDVRLFEKLGYNCYWHSAKKAGYSGVAILTKLKPKNIVYGCGIKKFDDEGRIIKAEFDNINILSCYFPSGSSGDIRQSFKMDFLKLFYNFIRRIKEENNTLVCGDFNICHKSIDIHDPIRNKYSSGFLEEERQWITSFLKLGFIDTFREINNKPENYSWWSYRASSRLRNKGWRIDYHMLSENLKKKIINADILKNIHHSDHCPILLEIS
ncbi:MAG: exodeoxyribonuclease III [Flavobacteriales bacterium]|jgi:exodeoxyribonuclease-3|nr:exodeoxyribonuclease III [Flavobacteriales bacterium]|tara:strand:- start:95 stop:853 length:759 start_codon:yes stop_codon:yes gene_type:complete